MPNMWNYFFGLFYFLILFAAILFLAYVSTKFLGVKVSRGMKGKYIKVVDSITLGFDKQVYLVKVGDQLLLISSSNKNIRFITHLDKNLITLDEEDLKMLDEDSPVNFNSAFKSYFETFRNKSSKSGDTVVDESTETANRFSQNLSKLKGIFSKINSEKNGDEKLNG